MEKEFNKQVLKIQKKMNSVKISWDINLFIFDN